ncbi:MAG: hypothetical protein ACOYMB_04175 [Patescibacteria group bacterium]
MSLDKPKRIEDYILRHLQAGPTLMLDLVKKLQEDRPKTTKQAVYAALRVLKQGEEIITYKGIASLNLSWLNSMASYFAFARHNYIKGEVAQENFIDLEDKEKIKYYFQNAIKGDIFWTHALYLIIERSETSEPFYLYNPHEWFLLARQENELQVFKTVIRKGHKVLLTTGNSTFLDRHVKNFFDNEKSQYHSLEKPLFDENNYYLNIIGDYLIEVWIDKKVADKMDNFYKENKEWKENIPEELKKIIDTESKMKIVISRNHDKTEKIKKSLKKYFVLK